MPHEHRHQRVLCSCQSSKATETNIAEPKTDTDLHHLCLRSIPMAKTLRLKEMPRKAKYLIYQIFEKVPHIKISKDLFNATIMKLNSTQPYVVWTSFCYGMLFNFLTISLQICFLLLREKEKTKEKSTTKYASFLVFTQQKKTSSSKFYTFQTGKMKKRTTKQPKTSKPQKSKAFKIILFYSLI